jgi:hypothetical protein
LFSWVYIQGTLWSIQQKTLNLRSFLVWFVSIQGRINVLFCGIVLPKAKQSDKP